MSRIYENATIRLENEKGFNLPKNNFKETVENTQVVVYEDGYVYVEDKGKEYSPDSVVWIESKTKVV